MAVIQLRDRPEPLPTAENVIGEVERNRKNWESIKAAMDSGIAESIRESEQDSLAMWREQQWRQEEARLQERRLGAEMAAEAARQRDLDRMRMVVNAPAGWRGNTTWQR